MITIDRDLAALLTALDAGDDSALAPLADWYELEGQGKQQRLAAQLRALPRWRHPQPVKLNSGLTWHGWQCGDGHAHSVAVDVAGRLDILPSVLRWGDWRLWAYRSAAYIALAQALAAPTPV